MTSNSTFALRSISLLVALTTAACAPTSAQPTTAVTQSTSTPPVVVSNSTDTAVPSPAPTAAPAATSAPAAMSADAVIEAVHQAWAAAGQAGPRRLVQTSSDADGSGIVIEAEFVPPDSMHQVVTIGGQTIAEQYNVGGVLYNNAPATGGWVQTALPGDATGALALFGEAASDLISYSDGRVDGAEAVNGYNAVIYAYSTQLEGFDKVVRYRLWVDTATGLPVKNEIVSDDGQTVQEIVYDSGVTIALPDDAANAPPAP